MTPEIEDTSSVDEPLRRGLDPAPSTVDRVVRRALDEPPGRGHAAGRPGRWLALATAIVLAVLAAWIVPRFGHAPPPEPVAAQVSMVNVGSIIVLETGRDGGKVLLSGTSATGDASWRGQIIIQLGERP